MTRALIALAAVVTTMGSLAAVHAGTGREGPAVMSTTESGQPILLARVVVTATAL